MPIKNKDFQDGQGDPPPPGSYPGWPPPPPRVMMLLYLATGSSLISLAAIYLRHSMVAMGFAAIATLAGAINIAMLSRR